MGSESRVMTDAGTMCCGTRSDQMTAELWHEVSRSDGAQRIVGVFGPWPQGGHRLLERSTDSRELPVLPASLNANLESAVCRGVVPGNVNVVRQLAHQRPDIFRLDADILALRTNRLPQLGGRFRSVGVGQLPQ